MCLAGGSLPVRRLLFSTVHSRTALLHSGLAAALRTTTQHLWLLYMVNSGSAAAMSQAYRQLATQQQQLPRPVAQQISSCAPAKAVSARKQQTVQCAAASQQRSRRQLLQLLTLGAAAAVIPASAHAATAAVSSSKALEEYMKLEDDNKLRDQRSLDNIRYSNWAGVPVSAATASRVKQLIQRRHNSCRCCNGRVWPCWTVPAFQQSIFDDCGMVLVLPPTMSTSSEVLACEGLWFNHIRGLHSSCTTSR